jgi:hypothetical protein
MKQYIVATPFNGHAYNIIDENNTLMFTSLTVEEYLKDNPSYTVVSEKDFDNLMNKFAEEKIKTEFVEVTEERWGDALECLPPVKWHTIEKRFNVFFMGEQTWGSYTSLYVKDFKTRKFYVGTKNVFSTDEEILREIQNEILK